MASTEKGQPLKPCDVQQIIQLPPTVAKEMLAQRLGIPPYLDTQDLQKAPFITYIYDSVMFTAERGFPWEHICLVIKFAHQFLKGILVEKHQLPDAIVDLKKKAVLLDPLSNQHKKQYVDYVFETVLCHYHLYKYVFSRLRDTIKPKIQMEVSVPPTPPPLSEGQSVNVWEYQQKLKEVEKKEACAQNKLRESEKKVTTEVKDHKTLNDLKDVPVPYSKMSLKEMVQDVLQGYAQTKEIQLKSQATEMVEDLTFKLEKTAVPRPAALGSPPRFKPKSPTGGRKNTNSNAKSEKVSSARSEKSKSGRASTSSGKSKR